EADDAHLALGAGGVGEAHGRAEENVRRGAARARRLGIDDLRGADLALEKPDAPIDLAQPPLVVLIVRVLAAIAVARRPGHHLRHRRPLLRQQEVQLGPQPQEAGRGDVVLARLTLRSRPPRETFAHGYLPGTRVFSSSNQLSTTMALACGAFGS